MNVLLINPPEIYDKNSIVSIGLPLGLLYLASVLEKSGKKVEIFDSMTYRKSLDERDIDNNLKHVGASWARIEEEIRKRKPDVVGISNHFSSQIESALKTAKIVKKINKKIIVVVGGPHASSKPEDFFKGDVDFIVRGEGEFAFLRLIQELEKEWGGKKASFRKIKNLGYLHKNKIKINPLELIANLDELPFPAYHLLNMENYFGLIKKGLGRVSLDTKNDRRVSMITSRGCPFNCIFCSIHGHMGRKWRAHSSKYVIGHIIHLFKNYKINHISFEDDNLTLDIKRFERILDGIKNNKIRISWDTPNGIRADRLDYNLVKKMKESGCSSIKIGIESGDQEIVNNVVGKALDLKAVVNAASLCKKFNIPLTGFFVIGMPGEKRRNIINTLNFAYMLKQKYEMDSVITIAMPLQGTRLYDISKEKGYLKMGRNPCEFVGKETLIIETEDFNMDFLKKVRSKFYKKVILLQIRQILGKPQRFLKYLSLLRNPKNIANIFNYLTK